MKRLTMILVVAAISMALVVPAMAERYKVPKTLCLHSESLGDLSLSFKRSTSIKGTNGRKKYYAVHGEVWDDVPFPTGGTAYKAMSNPNIISISLNGNISSLANGYAISWDLEAETGFMTRIQSSIEGVSRNKVIVESFDCKYGILD